MIDTSIESHLAKRLCQKLKLDETHLLFFIFLFAAAKEGHLCTEFIPSIAPSLPSLELEDTDFQIIRESYLELKEKDLAPFVFFEGHRVMLKIQKEMQEKLYMHFSRLIEKNLKLITGGPGTGKTTYIQNYLTTLENTTRIALLAPTGRAACHLSQKVPKAAASMTLHRFIHQYKQSFAFDVIVVDESSMIDVHLMLQLLQGIKENTQLILVGDPYQLPAIESGSVFLDFVKICQKKYPHAIVELKKNYRTKSKQIQAFSEALLEQNTHFLNTIFSKTLDDIVPLSIIDAQKKAHAFFYTLSQIQEPKNFFEKLKEFVMLSCFNHGIFGVQKSNEEIFQMLKETHQTKLCLPVLLTQNMHSLELFNGDVGMLVLEKKHAYRWHLAYVYFITKGRIQKYLVHTLPSIKLAFCLSIHKSQGSEYDDVLLMLDKEAHLFGKELLYTAVTRAKSKLYLVGEKKEYALIATQKTCRLSQLQTAFA
ncbi:MAG: RecBCD enzyme subunit RecD [Chlamydiae bacterium]|nr:RecBCD enzyme subunit RecD [Chlamydiota bacterium]